MKGLRMASKRKTRRLHLRLDTEDHERLETISEYYGLSLADSLRIAIRAMLRQIGFNHAKE